MNITSFVWLGFVVVLSLLIMIFPMFPAPSPTQALVIVVVTLVLMFARRLWSGISKVTWLVVFTGILILPFGVVARGFGGVDMLAFLFHYQFGTTGATIAGLEDEVSAIVLSAALFIIAVTGMGALTHRPKLVASLAATVLLSINPILRYGVVRLIEGPYDSGLVSELSPPKVTDPIAGKPDVLIVYLEGFERRYVELPYFVDAANILDPVLGRSTIFSDVRQLEGTGWSIAGVVSTQCGVPPLPNGLTFGNGFEELEEFLPHQKCLSDVLSDLGYRNEFVVGSELEFGGLRKFLASHSYDQITGIEEIRKNTSSEEFESANVDWNVDDQLVFDQALERQAEMLTSGQPFLLAVETFSLHSRNPVISRRCNSGQPAGTTSDFQRAATCAAADVVQFLEAFTSRQGDRPIQIVLMSDHLSHYDGQDLGLPQSGRRNLVSFLGDGGGRQIGRAGSMLDVYPTILDRLGLISAPKRAGLGVSLMAEIPTLVLQYGEEHISEAFLKDADLAAAIWQE